MNPLAPNLLDRLLGLRLAVTFGVVLSATALVSIALEAVLRIDQLLEIDVPDGTSVGGTILWYYLLRLPALIDPLIVPVSITAMVMTLAPRLRRRELIALVAAGVPLKRVARVMLIGACLIGCGRGVLAEWIAPRTQVPLAALEDALADNVRKGRIWKDPNTDIAWYSHVVDLRDPQGPAMRQLLAAQPDGGLIQIPELAWRDGTWQSSGTVTAFLPTADDWVTERWVAGSHPAEPSLSLPADGFIRELLSADAMTSAGLLSRGRSGDRAAAYQRWLSALIPLAAMLLAAPGFLRFANADRIVAAGVSALLVSMLPQIFSGIAPQLGNPRLLGPEIGIAVATFAALAPGIWRWWRWDD